ncbi:MAG: enoyl-CoA hydratase/isomerase family protein [Firmicutes bacterium]|nr:enoyl-CoA hydratase/isomerase family protein [Bacillota bacterium]
MKSKEILRALQAGEITPEEAENEINKMLGKTLKQSSAGLSESTKGVSPNGSSSLKENHLQMLSKSIQQGVVDFQEVDPGVVLLRMQDRINKNTFSLELVMGLMEAFETIQNNPNYKVVILTGYDNYFCCGGNKEGLLAIHEGKVKLTDIHVYRLTLDCKIPVIAAMQGHGIGSGWCLGLFSDFVVFSRESTYTCNHMKYGFTPSDGATLIFPEKLGKSLAQEILFTGKRFRGSELESKGISFPVLPRKEVLPYAIKLGKELAETPRESLILLKTHMVESIRKQLPSIVEKEWKMQEITFVNKPEVLEKILSAFDQSTTNDEKNLENQLINPSMKTTDYLSTVHSDSTHKNDNQPVGLSNPEPPKIAIGLQFPELVQLNRIFSGIPIFWVHGEGGGVEGYQAIAQKMQRPFYGINARGRLTNLSPIRGIPAMVSYYVRMILSVQPEGPYDLGGYSLGGGLAYEITRCLQEMGQTVNSIVMIDSLDSNGMKKINFSRETKLLQAVNMSLIYRIRQEPEKLLPKLIHRQKVNFGLSEEECLKQLIAIGVKRGLSQSKTEAELYDLFQQSLQVQAAFELDQYSVLPLPDPEGVTCYYFRNTNGSFYGEFEPYLICEIDKSMLDLVNYWAEWERLLPNFNIIELDSSNHLMMLFEPKICEKISTFCEKLYSKNSILKPNFRLSEKEFGNPQPIIKKKETVKKKGANGKKEMTEKKANKKK